MEEAEDGDDEQFLGSLFHTSQISGTLIQSLFGYASLIKVLQALHHTLPLQLTLVLLNPDIPCFANNVDPDQLASEEAN